MKKFLFLLLALVPLLLVPLSYASSQSTLHKHFMTCYANLTPPDVQQALKSVPNFLPKLEKESIANLTADIPFMKSSTGNHTTDVMINNEADKQIMAIADCMRSLQ